MSSLSVYTIKTDNTIQAVEMVTMAVVTALVLRKEIGLNLSEDITNSLVDIISDSAKDINATNSEDVYDKLVKQITELCTKV